MSVLSAFFIGLAVNLDNFLIGMDLGLKHQPLPLLSNFLISLTSGLFAFFPAWLARVLFSSCLSYAETIGAALMIFYGLWCLKKAGEGNDSLLETQPEIPVRGRQALFLGVLLAVNCIPPAVSAGAFFLSPAAVGLFCCGFSFLSLWLGNRLGGKIAGSFGTKFLPHLSALLLILIGLWQLLF
jgi:putative Mn2+ efflux pump MntP